MAAIIGLLGTVITAGLGFWAVVYGVQAPMRATQTAENKLTVTVVITSTFTLTPQIIGTVDLSTLTPTSTSTIEPSETPLPSATFSIGTSRISSKDGMTMLYVPAGEFVMGSENNDDDERPIHSVYLDGYWIDKTEVTNAMYKLCVQASLCQQPIDTGYFDAAKYADYPVVFVSWNNAAAYCEWAERRLPTEAEWEKAARGIDARMYPWGNGIDCKHANYGSCFGNIRIVGLYSIGASPYGALDMAGNVWEWVADWYGQAFYVNSPYKNPVGPLMGETRVLRSGSWESIADNVRTSTRSGSRPDYANNKIGFRCAYSN